MQGNPTSSQPTCRFNLFAQPFGLLGTNPAATSVQVHAAHALALERQAASPETLACALAAIVEPAQRLASELAYPIDSTPSQIETIYAALSGKASLHVLLQTAHQLAPLSRANFLAHLAARQPVSGVLLTALVDAHFSIEVTEIYTVLNALRNRAGRPTSSLVNVSDGLRDLFTLHAEAAIAGHDPIQGVAEPMLDCTERIIASGERHRVEFLSDLMDAYRQFTAPLRSDTRQRIENACSMLLRQPDLDSSIDELAGALRLWMSLCRPLKLLDSCRLRRNQDFEMAIDQVRPLVARLSARQHYEAATRLVDLACDVFSAVPAAVAQFEKAGAVLHNLVLESRIRPLRDLIARLERDPDQLVKALEMDGFGNRAGEPANHLWHAFRQAADATHSSSLSEQPWLLIRKLAVRLGNDAGTAATRLVASALRYGESQLVDGAILDTLRDDLSYFERKRDTATPPKSQVRPRLGQRTVLAASAAAGIFCIFIGYRYFDGASLPLAPVPDQPAAQTASLSEARTASEPEIVPPIGRGQHFERGQVRYCHFQEERLRAVKQELQGQQDIRAYNDLAKDYNSRCSDFFYLDDDLRIVIDEVNAKKRDLELDAKRILAGWSWRAAGASAPSTK